MKRFLALYTTPIAGSVIILLRIPAVEKWLIEKQIEPLYIGVALAITTIINHAINVYSPFKKYEKLEKNKWILLNRFVDNFVTDHSSQNIDFELNIMVATPKYLYKIEPKASDNNKKKISFFGKIFKTVWQSKDGTINRKLELTTKQGLSGKSYNEGLVSVALLSQTDTKIYNLTQTQEQMMSHLVGIVSCPIFEPDGQYNEKLTNKVIGVINVQSSSPDVESLLTNTKTRRELCNQIIALSSICNKIL